MPSEAFNIAIIGFGPKGFYGFERILAFLKKYNITSDVNIHLFNESEAFATGWVYDVNQPDYLLMNYPNQFISCAPASDPPALVTIPSFTSYISKRTGNSEDYENSQIAPRKEVGAYLSYYFNKLKDVAIPSIKIYTYVARVDAIHKLESGYRIDAKSLRKEVIVDKLLITTGHSPSIISKKTTDDSTDATIPFVYPFSEKLIGIKSQAVVSCKGLGLTAIDTILGLTEGRSGYFKKIDGQQLMYYKSGLEPKYILPFSRSGIPIIPRGSHTTKQKQISFYFKRFVSGIKNTTTIFDFESELLPIIEQDIIAAFYFQLFENKNISIDPDISFDELEKRILVFHKENPEVKPFSVSELYNPNQIEGKNTDFSVVKYWKFWITENSNPASPSVAAASAWRFISDDFNFLYSTNRLTPESKNFFQKSYFGLFNRISYGPPVQNIEKMIALHNAGILNFTFVKSPIIKKENEKFIFRSNTKTIEVDYLVDSRLPRGFSKEAPVIFNNSSDGLFSVEEKSIDYNELRCTADGSIINQNDSINKDIVCYGTPTENILFDNDTLSRKHNDTVTQWAQNTALLILKNTNRLTATNEY